MTLMCAGYLLGLLLGADISIPNDPQAWAKRLPNLYGTAEVRAGVLHVGPYRSGQFMLRLENRSPVNILNGSVLGEYRTSGLVPGQAEMQVTFTSHGSRVFPQATFRLSNPSAWTPFQLPIRRAPAGADAVTIGFGVEEKTEGSVEFRNIRISNAPYPLRFPPDPGPLTRSAPPRSFPRSTSWRLEEANGARWFVSPEGRPLYALATRPPATLAAVSQLRAMGFNAVGGGGNPPSWIAINDQLVASGQPYVPQFATLFTDGSGRAYDVVQDANGKHPPADHVFPDVFDPRWEPAFRNTVRAITSKLKNKPYLVAWFLDNERHHKDLPRYLYAPHSTAALRAFLERKYPSIAILNQTWGSNYRSLDELLAQKPDPGAPNTPMYADYHEFARLLVKRYVDTEVRIIHQEDPGRLVFSNRFMLGEIGDTFDYLDLYSACDGIALNLYPANIDAGLSQTDRDVLAETYRRTRKPVVITEWSVPALDSGFYSDPAHASGSYAAAVNSQDERARQAAKITVDFYNTPFIAGTVWFDWGEFNDDQGKASNRGLFRANAQPWEMLQSALSRANRLITNAWGGGR